MKRWTNGLPGATQRLGAKMAHRSLSPSQPRIRATIWWIFKSIVGSEFNSYCPFWGYSAASVAGARGAIPKRGIAISCPSIAKSKLFSPMTTSIPP
jgi:hypothetical protein